MSFTNMDLQAYIRQNPCIYPSDLRYNSNSNSK